MCTSSRFCIWVGGALDNFSINLNVLVLLGVIFHSGNKRIPMVALQNGLGSETTVVKDRLHFGEAHLFIYIVCYWIIDSRTFRIHPDVFLHLLKARNILHILFVEWINLLVHGWDANPLHEVLLHHQCSTLPILFRVRQSLPFRLISLEIKSS